MVVQRRLGRDKRFEIVFVVVRGTAAPLGVGSRCGVLRDARGSLRRLFGENVLESGIECLFHLGAAAEIAVDPFLGGRFKSVSAALAVAGCFAGHVAVAGRGWCRVSSLLATHQRLTVLIGALQ